MNPYIGHNSQIEGVEEHRLVGGRGDGLKLLEIHTAAGLDLAVVPDRCCDISRLRFKGVNVSYMSPCGYVAPAYYDNRESGWLRSFTAGFLTTCGLNNVGSPNTDEGETLPLHGSIANTPAEHSWWTEGEDCFEIHGEMNDETIFDRKLRLSRCIRVSKTAPELEIEDTVTNTGDRIEPVEILYHMNMGYPLLDEDSVITIPSERVTPRDDHAAEDLENWMRMEKPTPGYQERCYYHTFPDSRGLAAIWQPKLKMGLAITFDAKKLDGFVEWKMMGVRDYVLGLECGNCTPDGRGAMRKSGRLKFLTPGETAAYSVKIRMIEREDRK